jgi:hypothetical protein
MEWPERQFSLLNSEETNHIIERVDQDKPTYATVRQTMLRNNITN